MKIRVCWGPVGRDQAARGRKPRCCEPRESNPGACAPVHSTMSSQIKSAWEQHLPVDVAPVHSTMPLAAQARGGASLSSLASLASLASPPYSLPYS